jgi:hypothetical protein
MEVHSSSSLRSVRTPTSTDPLDKVIVMNNEVDGNARSLVFAARGLACVTVDSSQAVASGAKLWAQTSRIATTTDPGGGVLPLRVAQQERAATAGTVQT